MDEHSGPALEVLGLGKSYAEGRRRRTVLRDVGFDVAAGECVALLGRSGSGKSTLLNLLAGIDRPDTGEVRIMGRSVTGMGEPELTLLRRRHIGFIYQFFNLIPTLTVAENLALPLELNRMPAARRRERIAELLGKVGLDGREGAFPDQLSGGEQQRVAIARAIIHEPSLVLADEPTGNLDAHTGHRVLELLSHLFRDEGHTLILVTHSREVSAIADRIFAVEDGQLTERTEALSW
ncbi:MAG: ABC transporter ATP-binding protein [Thiohalocapsa sp.]|jgi:putative ABC transport system ATP-binding protein|uniref:ABC transporter ATP-binding protein n=1 Tax=Thiohalocapsa sp. TaxID=2497641 RepID=UPI0025CC7AD1|nr:ABC transporter ATP-binding protein [Thiohalocapsa sp.]MCG6943671.1 ABC transporter ATP-binding protein [Thiohalocapsa sp.]